MKSFLCRTLLVVCGATSALAGNIGPSTTVEPYIVGYAGGPNVQFTSVLTVGDSVNNLPDGITPYRLAGIPDGMGAYDNGDGTFTLLCNHELGSGNGRVRDHGGTGAYVSKWIINSTTLQVISGEDLIKRAFDWNGTGYTLNPTRAYGRFCSGDLPPVSAFYNAATGLGTQERIYIKGEEIGNEGYGVATIVTGPNAGDAYEIPATGLFSWENGLAAPGSGDTTVLMGMDDSSPGQVYVYVGTKTNTGNEIERAGLTNGVLYGIRVTGIPSELAAGDGLGGAGTLPFDFYNFGNVSNTTGATLEAQSNANSVTRFARPEDGHFDPSNPNDFYFVTTGCCGAPNRLWRVRFTDITNPALGGTITNLLNGTEGPVSMDNMMVENGHVVIQEDPGGSSRLAKTWDYRIGNGVLTDLAQHNPTFFQTGAPNFLTTNEEASGIIEMRDILGPGWYFVNVQAHYGIPGELVEGGQILAMYSEVSATLRGDMNCDGFISVGDIAGFVLALTDPAGYAAQFPNCDINDADVNFDGVVSVGDIARFVSLLTGA